MIEGSSGLRIDADQVALRLWPARLVADSVVIRNGQNAVASVDSIEARWGWFALALGTPRLEYLELQAPHLDIEQLLSIEPPPSDGAEPGRDPWMAAEIESFKLREGSVDGGVAGVAFNAQELSLGAGWVGGRVESSIELGSITLRRGSRDLSAGPVEIDLHAGKEGLDIGKLILVSEWAAFSGAGSAAGHESFGTYLEFDYRLRPEPLVVWWDPDLAARLDVDGELNGRGSVDWTHGDRMTMMAAHEAGEFSIANVVIDSMLVESSGRAARLEIAGSEWGSASVDLLEDRIDLDARLENLDPALIAASVSADSAERVPASSSVSGHLEVTCARDLSPDSLSGSFDLEGVFGDYSGAAMGSIEGESLDVSRLEVVGPGTSLQARGTVETDGSMAVVAEADIQDVEGLISSLEPHLSLPAFPEPIAGSIEARVELTGAPDAPHYVGNLRWIGPTVSGYQLSEVRLEVDGSLSEASWSASSIVDSATTVTAAGRLDIGERRVIGEWQATAVDLDTAAKRVGIELPYSIAGKLETTGQFEVSADSQEAAGAVRIDQLRVDELESESVELDFRANPRSVFIDKLRLVAYGANVTATGQFPVRDRLGTLTLRADVAGADLGELPLELPYGIQGRIDATVSAMGPLASPDGELRFRFIGGPEHGLIEEIDAVAAVRAGEVQIVASSIATAAGELSATIAAPIGSLPRPEFLWPEAEAGNARGTVRGFSLDSAPLIEELGKDSLPGSASGDLVAHFEVDPSTLEPIQGLVEIGDLEVTTEVETLRAEGPLSVEIRGSEFELKPLTLVGEETSLKAQGKWNSESGRIQGVGDLKLSPSLTRLLPAPLVASGSLAAQFAVWGSVDEPSGRVVIDHRGGKLRLRDPAVEIANLELDAIIEKGRLSIQSGSASVNRGRVDFGGGWDPDSGQGLVAEIEDASMILPHGVLTRWDGTLALEPSDDDRVLLTGFLVLKAGVWERPFNIVDVLRGGQGLTVAEGDPLDAVALDLEVWGSGGVEIDNNLGDFDVGWSVLRIGGTAAVPSITGDLRINPGGRIVAGGTDVRVRRGSIRFTGDPLTDPLVEIVPMEAGGAPTGSASTDLTLVAQRGLAEGLGNVFGFESHTIAPEEIAVETEKDSSSNFSIGTRINPYTALILTADPTTPGDYTTMLQLANLPGLRGLALQGYDRTGDDESGVRLIQRFSWGGASDDEDAPRIKKIRFDGKWPISKRKLRRAGGLTTGEPFDEFKLFVSAVRIEQELAAKGYQQARVEASVEGNEQRPTLTYRCDEGEQNVVEFEGDRLPRRVRHEVTATYLPAPFQEAAMTAMRDLIVRHFMSKGYPDASAEVWVEQDRVMVHSARGEKREFEVPAVIGLPEAEAAELATLLSGQLTQAELVRDRERADLLVQRVLRTRGYRDARLADLEVEPAEKRAERLVLSVESGEVEKISDVRLEGEDPLGALVARAQEIRGGERLDLKRIERVASTVRNRYREAGYANAEVRVLTEVVEDHLWRVTYRMEPGQKVEVATAKVSGARHLRDTTLQKGLKVEEGTVFRATDLDETVVNLATFPPVERVDVLISPRGLTGTDIEFEVTEKPRWTLDLGAGHSSERGAQGMFGIGDRNLFGRGISLNLRGRVDRVENLYLLYASIPTRPGGRLTFTSTLRYFEGESEIDPDFLSEEERSISLGASLGLGSLSSGINSAVLRSYYRFKRIHTFEKEPDPFAFFPIDITTDVATLGVQFIRNAFDNPFDPSQGYLVAGDVGWSDDAIGSDLSTLSTTGSFSLALQPTGDTTWIQSLRLGHAKALDGGVLDPEVRFFLGGQGTIRGFDKDVVGPTTLGFGGPVPAGGGALFLLNEELRIKAWGPARLAVFADIGQVWDSWSDAETEFAIGVGLGVRISTPIGPIWADVAWPVSNQGISSDGPKYYLGIGRPF